MGLYPHQLIATNERILPITEDEGTGIVHIAPGAGAEDFQLGKTMQNFPIIDVIDEEANYLENMAEFSGKSAKKHPELIIDYLKTKDNGKYFFKTERYTHRYPTCWRCKKELVWRVVDEWYIAMDKKDESGETYREQMVEVANKIKWMPYWGLDRELDWLKNMHDWLISKKR
jgi:isoleucyl-tRNA synthetase